VSAASPNHEGEKRGPNSMSAAWFRTSQSFYAGGFGRANRFAASLQFEQDQRGEFVPVIVGPRLMSGRQQNSA
jgi:hypothetical protein